MILRQHDYKEITTLASWMFNPDFQEESGLLLKNGDKEDYVYISGDLSQYQILLDCPGIKGLWKLQ